MSHPTKNYNKLKFPNYDLKSTLLGGQSFNWDLLEDGWYRGFTVDKVIKLKIEDEFLLWQTFPENNNLDFLKTYLRLDVNYNNIISLISKDETIKDAINLYKNLRILKQDFEQTLISYIISSNKNIRSIRNSIRILSKEFGEKIEVEGEIVDLFPSIEKISNLTIEELNKTRIGYRNRYVKNAAYDLINRPDIYNLIETRDEIRIKEELLRFKGIGNKVADCIMLYALGFDNITAFDVWGQRVLTDLYNLNPKMKYREMSNWTKNYFNGFAGWAGQFLFEYIRQKED